MEHFKKPIETIVRDLKKPFQFSKAYLYIYRRIQSVFFFFFLSFCFRMVDNKSTDFSGLKSALRALVKSHLILQSIHVFFILEFILNT
jgi:hypothetical protein